MIYVNGLYVRLVNAAPKRVAAGWLHSTSVYLHTGEHVGFVEEISTAKHGGRTRETWCRLGTWAAGRMIPFGHVRDLVDAWCVEQAGELQFVYASNREAIY